MTTATAIPATVAADAAARVAELGMGRAFEKMLERIKQIIPGLRLIEVTLEYDPCGEDDPVVAFTTYQPEPGVGLDPTDEAWGAWFLGTFPPDVCRHFARLTVYEATHGR